MTPGRLTLPAVLAALLAAGCHANREPTRPAAYTDPTGRNADPNRMSPDKLTTFAVMKGIQAGAKAGQEEVARAEATGGRGRQAKKVVVIPPAPPAVPGLPPVPPAPPAIVIDNGRSLVRVGPLPATEAVAAKAPARPQPAIKLTKVRSDKPHPSPDLAKADALLMAQVDLVKALQRLDPPVNARPSLAAIRREYVRKDSEEVIPVSDQVKAELVANGLDPNRVWVAFDVELSEQQVQALRAGERVNAGFQAGGVLFAVLLAVYGFLRLDAWSKGYLTSWLAIGAVALVVVAALVVLG